MLCLCRFLKYNVNMSEEKKPIEKHKPEGGSSIEKLANELAQTNEYLEYAFSMKMVVIRGLVTGFAIVIGSTVLVSITLSILQLLFGDIPYMPSL